MIENMDWILDFFEKDEQWYKETKQIIRQKEKELPDNLDHKEKIKALYGWIANETNITNSLNIPLEHDREYSKASCIEMVFNGQIDLYQKIINWD